MTGSATVDRPHVRLLDWLARQGIEFEVHRHAEAFTAQASARAEGVDARTFAKVVGVTTDGGRRVLLVLDATDHVDLRKAREALAARDVRLLSETELADLAPDSQVGAIPAVGQLFGLPMYADYAVRDDPAISFNAGNHHDSVRVERAAWERATAVKYADLVEESSRRPAWARS
jgi:Ala-tRNA(Pro) deacylase